MTQPNDLAAATGRTANGLDEAAVKARSGAIVGLVLAVLSLQGQGSWGLAIQAIFGLRFGPDQFGIVLALTGLATLGLSMAGFVLGRRASSVHGSVASWEHYVGRAAVVLGALGAVISVVTVVGSLLSPGGEAYGPIM
ncbi:MAG TPA: hypothetical protein VGD51_02445 [Nocardioidaceae bacterium]